MTMIERAARAIAEALGDKLDNVPVNKREWLEERGMFGGAFRDINLPFRSDYEDASRAAIAALRPQSEREEIVAWLRREYPFRMDNVSDEIHDVADAIERGDFKER